MRSGIACLGRDRRVIGDGVSAVESTILSVSKACLIAESLPAALGALLKDGPQFACPGSESLDKTADEVQNI